MKVYLVSRSEPSEGQDIEAAFTTQAAAQAFADKQNAEYHVTHQPYEVLKFEVQE